eukprot:TRINITY_DN1225_c0_g1_i4.p1 TRINITY_DN1225_c0_g1~~TRINITY_DN1225_c0_g1_i4.p1  ORF type:complete len:442 (+),score=102.04 TRINITY_DN1225_c0_g1_i4:899-2224(+)
MCSFLILFSIVFMDGMCWGTQPVHLSTRFTRMFEPDWCPPTQTSPCLVYVTAAKDMSSSAIVNYHTTETTELATTDTYVYYDTVSHGDVKSGSTPPHAMQAKGFNHIFDAVRKYTLRRIHSTQLTGLLPNATYYFVVGNKDIGFSKEKKLRTLPALGDDRDITFLEGGDSGRMPNFPPLLEEAAKFDPAFMVFGGDIAYANAIPACYRLWDHWFILLDQYLNIADHGLVQIIAAPGNHETGGWLLQDKYTVPHYYNYLPFDGIDTPTKRLSYHAHYFGKTLVVALDSGHDKPWGGEQLKFLQNTFSEFANQTKKFAFYHSPLWPSRKPFDWWPGVAGRKIWMPEFDKAKLTAGFEHHEHSMKRTKFMINGVENANGTIYLGDGCMGVPVRGNGEGSYIAKFKQVQHIWKVQMYQNLIRYTALGVGGTIEDRVEQTVYPENN